MTGRIEFLSLITRDMVRLDREARFCFGDNLLRRGYGGQAGEMRGEPNAIGIATKRFASMMHLAFFSDNQPDAWIAVNRDIERVAIALQQGRTVYVPKAGLGTGLSQMPKRAPRLYEHLCNRFRELAGGSIPWN